MGTEELLSKLLNEAEKLTQLLQSIDQKLKDIAADSSDEQKEEPKEEKQESQWPDENRDPYERSYGKPWIYSDSFQRQPRVKNDEIAKRDHRIRELNICVGKLEKEKNEAEMGKKKLKKEYDQLNEDYQKLNKDYQDLDKEYRKLNKDLQELDQKNQNLSGQIRTKDESIRNLTDDYKNVKEDRDSLNGTVKQLTAENSRLRKEKDNLEGQNRQLNGYYEKLQAQQENLNDKYIEAQQALQSTFADGREYFETFNQPDFLGEDTREEMKTVFAHPEEFESFICTCGSLDKEKLSNFWEIIRQSREAGLEDEADFLLNLFSYALDLVNSTKSAPLYDLLTVEPGDDYRTSLHSTTINSPAQGIVQEVLLPGFKNVYTGQVIKRSLVRLG